jgi:preprotein translocase subunit SecE
MPVQEDVKRSADEGASDADRDASDAPSSATSEGAENGASVARGAEVEPKDELGPGPVASPTQLGTRRFVYAGYFAAALGIAFLMSKAIEFAWLKLQSWKPAVGEPRDDVVLPISGLVGAGVALYFWRRTRARQLAEEVATEMSKVTWPSRTEVTNGTVVVIVTTLVSTVFFALMDKFWGFVTNLVYGGT